MSGELLSGLVVWYAVFLFSTTFHEAMHSFVSHRGGDDTAYQGGQVTLNPLPHIQRSPFGMVVVPLLTFFLNKGTWMIGWASAPFNPYWAARYPRRSFLMSLAGPLSHLPLVLISLGIMLVGLRNGFFAPMDREMVMFPVSAGSSGTWSWALATLVNVAFKLNTVLLVFNLIPFPPLDGSEVWYLFVKREEDRLRLRAQANSYTFAGLLLAWYVFPKIYGPVMIFLVRWLYALAL
jgi:Zn-dependent proteases